MLCSGEHKPLYTVSCHFNLTRLLAIMVELGQTKAGSNIWLRMALLEIILEILKTIRALKSEIILKIMYFLIILNLIFIKVTNCLKNVCLKIYNFWFIIISVSCKIFTPGHRPGPWTWRLLGDGLKYSGKYVIVKIIYVLIFQTRKMPKRQKEAKLLPGEGRPTESLNLGDFLFAKVSQKKATSQQKSSTSSESDFPDLCLSSASEVKVNSNSRTPLSSDSAALASTSTPQSSELSAPTELPYSISKTKKGSLPIRLESRTGGIFSTKLGKLKNLFFPILSK